MNTGKKQDFTKSHKAKLDKLVEYNLDTAKAYILNILKNDFSYE